MFTKLLVVCALAAVALCTEYPPGVNPVLCPNYPYCDMNLLARYTMDGRPIPEWVYNPYILPYPPMVTPLALPTPLAPAARYPADFDVAKCPNYPYCN